MIALRLISKSSWIDKKIQSTLSFRSHIKDCRIALKLTKIRLRYKKVLRSLKIGQDNTNQDGNPLLRKEGKEFLEGCPILVDSIDNEAEKKYSGLPERLYVILDGEIIYAGEMGPFGYSIKEVDECLAKLDLK